MRAWQGHPLQAKHGTPGKCCHEAPLKQKETLKTKGHAIMGFR